MLIYKFRPLEEYSHNYSTVWHFGYVIEALVVYRYKQAHGARYVAEEYLAGLYIRRRDVHDLSDILMMPDEDHGAFLNCIRENRFKYIIDEYFGIIQTVVIEGIHETIRKEC